MRSLAKVVVGLFALFIQVGAFVVTAAPTSADTGGAPRYKHIFTIVEENRSFGQIIGNSNAPQINQLANTYGLATASFGTSHPSEPNYVAMVGGNDFGIKDDGPYTTNRVDQPSLASQLEGARLSWKAYSQSLPSPGFAGTCFPCNSSDPSSLYASKHNGFLNFSGVQDSPAEMQKNVPIEQLNADLAQGAAPTYSLVVPDQCHDMHGTNDCPDATTNVKTADTYASQLVNTITSSQTWKGGQDAIVLTFDEGIDAAGCCDANPGGGQIVTVVITNHGPRAVKYSVPSNHYSMLLTYQQAFGLGCLQYTCDAENVKPLTPLFATE